jgi:hypothetical protein
VGKNVRPSPSNKCARRSTNNNNASKLEKGNEQAL